MQLNRYGDTAISDIQHKNETSTKRAQVSTPSQKGRELEDAISALENTILQSSSLSATSDFRITTRQIRVIDGVRYEVDVWVELMPASGYGSLFIFETKNWIRKVGKSQIIDFIDKINATGAAQGFFIAKKYTRDAIAKARECKRLKLLYVHKSDYESLPALTDFHQIFIKQESVAVEVSIKAQGGVPLITGEEIAIYNGVKDTLKNFVQKRATEIQLNITAVFPSGTLPAGTYNEAGSKTYVFGDNELTIADDEIALIRIDVMLEITINRPAIFASYDVPTRGRIVRYEPVQFGSITTAVNIIEAEAQAT